MPSERPDPPAPDAKQRRPLWQRFLPLGIILLGFGAFFLFDGPRYLSLETLAAQRQALNAVVAENAVLAALGYIFAYIVVVAFSLPGGLVLSLTGGFLFGTWLGGLYTLIGATLGATAIFLAARTAFSEILRRRAGPWLDRFRAGFEDDMVSYLLVLRLVPLFPFFLVNLAPAFLGVPLSIFVITTFIGIIPGTFVYTSVGNGLGAVLERGDDPDLSLIWDPAILGPIIGLAVLALLPVAYKRWKAARVPGGAA